LKFLKSLEPIPDPVHSEHTNKEEGEVEQVPEEDPNLDEIDLLIRKEENEAARLAKEAEENSVKEAKLAKEKKIKDDAMAAKMEDIRKQERDLLD